MQLSKSDKEYLASKSPILFLEHYNIKNEVGNKIDFRDHYFQYDMYQDFTPVQAVQKPAQVGESTKNILKTLFAVKYMGLDAIYTLPTIADAKNFVGGKVNRIIANNPVVQSWTEDKDTVEQKQIGKNMIYYRGTWTDKAAMTVTSDLNVYDEVDASKQEIIESYATRLQHSDKRWEWWFSHPSVEGFGVNKIFIRSDQKHWFIKCSRCSKKQFMSFPENINLETKQYQCKFCKQELREEDRRIGEWVKKYRERDISGYQITSLMCPWIPASRIIEYYEQKTEEYFHTKVLGLPYVGRDNVVNEEHVLQNCEDGENKRESRIVIGCDTGLTQWYVMGNREGIFYYGKSDGYEEIEKMMNEYRNAILVMDSKGDLTKPRELQAKYPNRVFMCEYRVDRKTQQLATWGIGKESGTVVVDRNRMMQFMIDELKKKYIRLNGKKEEWLDYVEHFKNIYRTEEEDQLGIPRRTWHRKGDDHLVHASLYWRVGMSKYAQSGAVVGKPIGMPKTLPTYLDVNGKALMYEHQWRLPQ